MAAPMSRFKSDSFLDEVKRSYTDLINIYVKNKFKIRMQNNFCYDMFFLKVNVSLGV